MNLINEYNDKFCLIAEALLTHETLTKDQLERIMSGREIELKSDDKKEDEMKKESDVNKDDEVVQEKSDLLKTEDKNNII